MGGAPRRGSVQRGNGPPVTMPLPIPRVPDRGGRRATTPDRRYDSSASFAYGQAGGAARRSRHGRRGLRRRRRRGWGAPVAAAAQIQQGGTLNYAADQEQTGFNHNTSKDNGTSAVEHRDQHLPVGVPHPPRLHGPDQRRVPGLGRADQRGPADDRLQDQAERRLVGRHPDHGRRLHLPVEELQRTIKDTDVVPHHRLRPGIERSTGLRQRQDGHGRLQDPVRRLEVALLARTSSPPTTPRRSRAAGTPAWTRTPRRSPRPGRSSSRTTPPARA